MKRSFHSYGSEINNSNTPHTPSLNQRQSQTQTTESLQFLIIKFLNSLKILFSEKNFLCDDVLELLLNFSDPLSASKTYFLKIIQNEPALYDDFKLILTTIINESKISTLDDYPSLRYFLKGDKINDIPVKFSNSDINESFFKNLLFSQIYKTIGNDHVYKEYLKLVNLYNQDIISSNQFIDSSIPFLKNRNDIIVTLKRLVGFSNSYPLDLNPGPSYRLIASVNTPIISPSVSNDDPILELNNIWMSHPTWASERTEFVHHKKNQYEEAMFRVEEERHQIQIDIETNKQLIDQLSPIVKRIQKMSEIDKENLTLPFRFGGNSIALPRRALKNVYDAQRSVQVLEALHTHPAVAAPLILRRLEQKDREWRKLKEDLSKNWKDIENKNYYKSLDHGSSLFKIQDRKYTQSKYLINEVQASRHDFNFDSLFVPHLRYKLDNKNIIIEVLNFLSLYFRKHPNIIPSNSRMAVKSFILFFFSKLLGIKSGELGIDILRTLDSSEKSVIDIKTTQSSTNPSKKIVSVVISPNKTPFHSKNDSNENIAAPRSFKIHNICLAHLSNNLFINSVPFIKSKSVKSFYADCTFDLDERMSVYLYCDVNIYLFSRIFSFIYSRFESMYMYQASCCPEPNFESLAHHLSLLPKAIDTSELKNLDLYNMFLYFFKRLLSGAIDSSTYEDSMRIIFKEKSHLVFSIDKHLSNLSKQLVSSVSNANSMKFLDLFEASSTKIPIKSNSLMKYYNDASTLNSKFNPLEPLYGISFSSISRNIGFQYISNTDASKINSMELENHNYDEWVDYILEYASQKTDVKIFGVEGNSSFEGLVLSRNFTKEIANSHCEVSIYGPLVIYFKNFSYKINYKAGSSEYFVNHSKINSDYLVNQKISTLQRSKTRWIKFLDSKLVKIQPSQTPWWI
ncbi:Transcriptional regulatory protein SIN3 [Smittium mucronatum]|uniref:Transcriptional regulatory protein SIN3 n=1 Tax=Smittium mucronatum TaxID=133383 RepID=A0A1R0H523_9FUNG|nr:Transcriptional regulatory protein SIN3 [Smittium mucronatum]